MVREGRHGVGVGRLGLTGTQGALIHARDEIERASTNERDPAEMVRLEVLAVDQVGALGRAAAKRLRDLCEEGASDGPQWHIRICLDEAEALSDEQQVVFNTMVRLSGFPLFFIAAFAAMPRDPSGTAINSLTLSEADRHLDIRDEMDDRKFKQLTVGVSESRIQAMLGNPEAQFDLDKILGPLELDRWTQEILASTESAAVSELLERAAALALERGLPADVPPPILETFQPSSTSDSKRHAEQRRTQPWRPQEGARSLYSLTSKAELQTPVCVCADGAADVRRMHPRLSLPDG